MREDKIALTLLCHPCGFQRHVALPESLTAKSLNKERRPERCLEGEGTDVPVEWVPSISQKKYSTQNSAAPQSVRRPLSPARAPTQEQLLRAQAAGHGGSSFTRCPRVARGGVWLGRRLVPLHSRHKLRELDRGCG